MTSVVAKSNVKLEEAVARLSDSVNVQTRNHKQMEHKLDSIQNLMNHQRPQAAQPGYNRGLAPLSNHVLTNPSTTVCFYCRGPHRMADCEHALKHLDLKWIVRIDGYFRLPGGSYIPRDGSKSLKEVVEALNQVKPGIIPMGKIQDKAALYQGNHKTQSLCRCSPPKKTTSEFY